MSVASEIEAQCALARFFGSLLVFELDGERLVELRAPDVAPALSALGIDAPEASTPAAIDELAAEFHELILRPAEGGPLVQSLWTSGSYQGDAAVKAKQLADVAALEFDDEAARGAQPDHLGTLLLLWAETRVFAPEVAARVEQEHFRWALTPLAQLARGGGFYGQVGNTIGRWLHELLADNS